MPFQSEKQRKYLWANEPAIAKRWEKYPKGYNTGGVSHLFRSKEDRTGFNKGTEKKDGTGLIIWGKSVAEQWPNLNESQKDYIRKHWPQHVPKGHAQGGYIRPEEDGVLGLADGGQLVKPGPGRPGYNGDYDMDWGSEAETQDTSSEDHGAGDPDQFNMTPPAQNFPDWESGSDENTWATMSDEMAEKSKAETERVLGDHGDPMGNPDEQAKYARYVKYNVKNQAPQKKRGFWGTMALLVGAYTGLAPLFGVKIGSGVRTASFILNKRNQINTALKYAKKYNLVDKNVSFDKFVKDQVEKAKINYQDRKEKMALYKSLPDGHPEKIALSVELQIGKKPEHLGDGDGDNIDITYENIKETNDLKEKVRASGETMDLLYAPEKEDRSKQIAYWQSLMAPYMGGAMGMAAEGGRVPGYNTGGLSNLFRLKNK